MPLKFNINGAEHEVDSAKNILQGVLQAGVEVPHYCWHPGLSVVASCRLCLVEAGTTDPKDPSKVLWQPKLVPSCQTPPSKDGVTYVKTDTPKVRDSQKQVMEFLLINHPLDCPVCDQAGECLLQDFSFKYGNSRSRFVEDKIKQPKKDIGPNIVLFGDRCIMCSRCVRFEQEVSGRESLLIANRGNHCEIDVFPGQGIDHAMSGNVGDLCPVGALEDKNFLYRQRVWFLRDQPSVCPGCSTGCSIWLDANPTTNILFRLRPRTNLQVNEYWMCDHGRYGWKYVHDAQRLVAPRLGPKPAQATQAVPINGTATTTATTAMANTPTVSTATPSTAVTAITTSAGAITTSTGAVSTGGAGGQAGVSLPMYRSTSGTGTRGLGPAQQSPWERYKFAPPKAAALWSDALAAVRTAFAKARDQHGPASVAVVVSPMATNEETYLAAIWLRSFGPQAPIALGPVPDSGHTETFKSGFTIRSEKAPNRRGVEAVLAGLAVAPNPDQGNPQAGPTPTPWSALLAALSAGQIKALLVFGGYSSAEILAPYAATLRAAEFLAVMDILSGPLTDKADVLLPSAAFAERDGSWINHAGVIQHFDWSLQPPGEARRDGQILHDLLGRPGLYNAADTRAQLAAALAAAVPAFAALISGELPAEGLRLEGLPSFTHVSSPAGSDAAVAAAS